MDLISHQNTVIILMIVLALTIVGIFVSSGQLKGFLLYPVSKTKLSEAQEIGQSTQVIGSWILLFGMLGFGAMAVTSCGANKGAVAEGAFWQMIGNDILIALAAGAVGGLLGFLFGVPRTIDPATGAAAVAAASQAARASQAVRAVQAAVAAGQGNAPPPPPENAVAAPATVPGPQAALAANTNLERISDWLTTLLIGATLAESRAVIKWVGDSGTRFGIVKPADETLIPIVIVYYLVLGFLGIYLITRLYLTLALQRTLALLTGVAPRNDAVPLTLAAVSLPDGQTGQAYPPTTMTASGGTLPLTWSVSPSLPDGLALTVAAGHGASATVAGSPTAAAARASYTITVTDNASPANTASITTAFEID